MQYILFVHLEAERMKKWQSWEKNFQFFLKVIPHLYYMGGNKQNYKIY